MFALEIILSGELISHRFTRIDADKTNNFSRGKNADKKTLLSTIVLSVSIRVNLVAKLGYQSGLLADLHGLSSPLRTELIEQPTGMSFDGVFADKKFGCDFTVA